MQLLRKKQDRCPVLRQWGGLRAFTMVEVLVAAVVGAIIFAALYAGISNSYSLLQTSRTNLRATQIMVSRLEGLRLYAWGSSTNASQLFNTNIVPASFTDYFYPLGLSGQTNNLGATFNGTMTITTNITLSPSASYRSNMALVTVTLTWTDGLAGHKNTHTRHMSTYVAQYGIQNYVVAH